MIGIDVAADQLNCVALDPSGSVVSGGLYAANELSALVGWAAGASVVAIDAPAQLSTAPHFADESLSPKFRVADVPKSRLAGNGGSGFLGRAR